MSLPSPSPAARTARAPRAGLRERLRGRLRPPRRLEVTREGRTFLVITVGIGLAAVNTGNNLLYLLLGWLLSTIVASGALSDLVLRGVAIARHAPAAVHAGRPFLVELDLTNRKRRLASFAVEAADLEGGRLVDKRCFFLKVGPGQTRRASYRHTLHRRGVVRMGGVVLATRFPFGLFRKSRALAAVTEVVVYPAVRPLDLPTPRGRRHGEAPAARLGRRGEFFALREYREGDDRRAIHWRSSARAGALLVRELEEESQRRASIFLDNALEPGAGEAREQALEDAIATAASLAIRYLGAGYAVRVVARGALVGPHAGPGDDHRLLHGLALLAAAAPGAPFAAQPARGEDAILIVPEGSPPAVDHPVTAEPLAALAARGRGAA